MRKGLMILTALSFIAPLMTHPWASAEIIEGEVIMIVGEMVTIKTESEQGFEGSRETIHVDPKTTEKKGEFKVGTRIQADVDVNAHANWIKPLNGTSQITSN